MKFWEEYKKKCARKYISDIIVADKSNKERNKWMVLIYGQKVDDLLPGEPQNIIPFEETYYLKTKIDAEESGKIAWDKGHKVEIWKLIKRW